MTITRPCRRIIRHLLQIFLTLGLTFTACVSSWARRAGGPATVLLLPGLLVPVHDPPAAQVVGTELDHDPVVGQDADIVHPHFPADMSENLVPVV